MTSKKRNHRRGGAQSRPGAGPKKPYATLDLNAREVKSRSSESDKATTSPKADTSTQVAASKVQTPASIDSAKTDKPVGKSGETAKQTSVRSSQSAKAGKTQAASGSTTPSASEGTSSSAAGGTSGKKTEDQTRKDQREKKSPAKSEGRKRSGFGSFVSHMAAGIVGGALALFGGQAIIPKLVDFGIPVPDSRVEFAQSKAEIDRRLDDLETLNAQQDPGLIANLQAKLNDADNKLAELSALSSSVTKLEERQEKLISDVAAAEARSVPSDRLGPIIDRVSGLEQKLSTIEAASGGESNGSGIANIAAITGRVVDLETNLNNQMEALRASVGKDIESRVSTVSEASAAAQTGTKRLDRQLATVSTNVAQLSSRLDALKTDNDKLQESLRIAKDETGKVANALSIFEGDVNKTLSGLVSAQDLETSVRSVSTEILDLKDKVSEVTKAEKNRKANAQRIVLSLELSNLKRALDRGENYSSELGKVRKAAGGRLDLTRLEAFEQIGVPTLSMLQTEFGPVANAIIDAAMEPADGSVIDQLLAGARSIVRVRKINHAPDDTSVEAVVLRMEKALVAGQLDDVVEASKALPPKALEAAQAWLSKVETRLSVGAAVREIENQLKSSLSGGGEVSRGTDTGALSKPDEAPIPVTPRAN